MQERKPRLGTSDTLHLNNKVKKEQSGRGGVRDHSFNRWWLSLGTGPSSWCLRDFAVHSTPTLGLKLHSAPSAVRKVCEANRFLQCGQNWPAAILPLKFLEPNSPHVHAGSPGLGKLFLPGLSSKHFDFAMESHHA